MEGGVDLVQVPGALLHVVLDGPQGGHDGRGAEAVRDVGEVSEMSLNAGLQHGLGPSVAEGGPVVVEELHQLLTDIPAIQEDLFSSKIKENVEFIGEIFEKCEMH